MNLRLKLILILCVFISVCAVGRYVYYGSFNRNCIYTEEDISVPEELAESKIIVAKDAYLAVGKDKNFSCLKKMSGLEREIIGPETINNTSIGRNYFTNRGLKVESLKKGVQFNITGIIAVTKHGLTTVDSGSGPTYYLTLKDENNIPYTITTAMFGFEKKDLFLSLVDPTKTIDRDNLTLLSVESFHDLNSPMGGKTFSYTGKLTELQQTDLDGTEPQWKKLADKLERGEKFNIEVEIELRDDYYNEIKLSSIPEERYNQIAQIQDKFIEKIPKNLNLNSVIRNKAWPYIDFEANLDLLNYLVDNRVILKIKSLSESVVR